MAGVSNVCSGDIVTVQEVSEEVKGLGIYAVCETCGYDRRVEDFAECWVCKLKRESEEQKSQILALNLELREVKEVVTRLSETLHEVRQVSSTRPKVRYEGRKEAWPVVGDSEMERRDGKQAKRGDSDSDRKEAEKGKGSRCQNQKEQEGWQKVVGGGRPGKRVPLGDKTEVVPLQNRFEVLGEEVDGRGVEELDRERQGDRRETGPEVLLVGDSQVRYLDRTFCERARDRRTRVCFPGARVQDVADRLDRLMVGTGKDAVVVLHVGGNDVGRTRSEELIGRYRNMLEKVKASGRTGVVCGLIPRRFADSEWLSRSLSLNSRLEGMCRELGFLFVDGWDTFYGKHAMYTKDGVHLSKIGTEAYGAQLEGTVRGIRQGN